MSGTEQPALPAITLEELAALNEEIAALTRAGVPLEPALTAMAGELPGRLGRLAEAIARETGRGRPLAEVLGDPALGIPPVYRAVVEAGMRAWRLPAALESVARSIRRIHDVGRDVSAAVLYPMFIVAAACLVMASFTGLVAPRMLSMMRATDTPGTAPMGWMTAVGEWALVWGPLAAVAVLGLGGLWWFRARRASVLAAPRAIRLLGFSPWVRRTLHWARAGTFAEVLALLVENDVPLEHAVVLAAETTGDAGMVDAAGRVAQQIERGEPAVPDDDRSAAVSTETADRGERIPPLLGWLLRCGHRETLLAALRHAADTYHRRARRQAELARMLLPVVITLGVGGTVVLGSALAVFWPYASTLRTIAAPLFE